jgi:hypothetical protein
MLHYGAPHPLISRSATHFTEKIKKNKPGAEKVTSRRENTDAFMIDSKRQKARNNCRKDSRNGVRQVADL